MRSTNKCCLVEARPRHAARRGRRGLGGVFGVHRALFVTDPGPPWVWGCRRRPLRRWRAWAPWALPPPRSRRALAWGRRCQAASHSSSLRRYSPGCRAARATTHTTNALRGDMVSVGGGSAAAGTHTRGPGGSERSGARRTGLGGVRTATDGSARAARCGTLRPSEPSLRRAAALR